MSESNKRRGLVADLLGVGNDACERAGRIAPHNSVSSSTPTTATCSGTSNPTDRHPSRTRKASVSLDAMTPTGLGSIASQVSMVPLIVLERLATQPVPRGFVKLVTESDLSQGGRETLRVA